MNNFRAAGFEDAGNNLEQIKYHPVVTTLRGAAEREMSGALIKTLYNSI